MATPPAPSRGGGTASRAEAPQQPPDQPASEPHPLPPPGGGGVEQIYDSYTVTPSDIFSDTSYLVFWVSCEKLVGVFFTMVACLRMTDKKKWNRRNLTLQTSNQIQANTLLWKDVANDKLFTINHEQSEREYQKSWFFEWIPEFSR